ncbi:MAG: transporter permease [Myxococcaceae bacterium]|nr:transporter permease [Myxococcaceae bacterium]
MRRYLVRRLVQMVPTFLGITLLTFAISHLAPGDPLQLDTESASAAGGSAAATAAFREAHGLNLPLPVQYGRWLKKILTFDFGRSLQDHRLVSEKLAEALPQTLLLALVSLFLAYLLAIPIGVHAAARPHSVLRRGLSVSLYLLYAMPTFWVAVMLLLVLGDLFPFQGLASEGAASLPLPGRILDTAWHLVLPVFCLSYPTLAVVSRQVRAAMQEALAQDYVRAARARGIPERSVIFRHALRNSLLPVVTMLGMSLPHLIGGSVVVERVFGINGMGLLAFEAISLRDYPVVMAICTLAALVTMVSVLIADLLYGLADPRIRVGEEA